MLYGRIALLLILVKDQDLHDKYLSEYFYNEIQLPQFDRFRSVC